jgi:hypothetical protein
VRLYRQGNPDNGDEGLSNVRIAVFRCCIVCLPAHSGDGTVRKTFLEDAAVGNPESCIEGGGMMLSILVVDDEQQTHQLIRETLEQGRVSRHRGV